jgi:hypothetical protein
VCARHPWCPVRALPVYTLQPAQTYALSPPSPVLADAALVSWLSDAHPSSAAQIEDPASAEPPIPGLELDVLTIAGMQYSTGLGFEPGDCHGAAGVSRAVQSTMGFST